MTTTLLRIKDKLRSGEIQVRGDQWPLFLYADLAYDPEDPWNGLLRNQLLITVCNFNFIVPSKLTCLRASNLSSLHQVLSTRKNSEQPGQEMPTFTG
jgi:hypothetical protein